jgi:hypothetical protein
MVVFVVVARACSVVTRDGVSGSARQFGLRLVPQLSCVTREVCVTMALCFFVLLASSFLYVLLLIQHLLREIWGINLPDLPEVSHVECLLFTSVALALRQFTLL